MSWDDFRKQMEEAHKRAQAEFANTERIVTQDDVKLWEIEACIVYSVGSGETWVWPNVVPVRNTDGVTVGAATVFPQNTSFSSNLIARATLDYNIPERMDFDNNEPVFLYIDDDFLVDIQPDLSTYTIKGLVLLARPDNTLLDGGPIHETSRPKEN